MHFAKCIDFMGPSADLCVIEWGHGPAHIFGGVELTFPTTGTGKWRNQAHMHARALLQATGGVVCAEYGVLRIVVPERWATTIHAKLAAQCRDLAGQYDSAANEARLVTAGVARWIPVLRETEMELEIKALSADEIDKLEGTVKGHGNIHLVTMRALESADGMVKATVTAHCLDGVGYDVRVPVQWCEQEKLVVHAELADVRNEICPSLNRNRRYTLDENGGV
jgi:hypothetical protein